MNPKILKYSEIGLFYAGVLFNVWILLHFTYFGLGDGPSHLYYSKIVQFLLSGNSFLSQYFVLNHLPVPNLTDHYLLAFFDIFLHSVISEKLLLFIFVAGFPLIFRYIIYKYNPEGIAASTFIIPLTHCTLLYTGGYNFCISFTFLFVAVYYYLQNFPEVNKLFPPFKYLLFFLLILLNYFTNGLSFLFLLSICGMAELYWLFRQRKLKAITNRHIVKRFLLFGALWIPGFIMLSIFNSQVPSLHHASLLKLSFSELLQWVYDFKCLFVYDDAEYFYTHILFFWLMITLFITVYLRLQKKINLKFMLTDIFLLLFLLTFIAYFIIPESVGVGLISDRLFYYFIVFLVLWLALQKNMGKITLLLSGIVMLIHVLFFFNAHYTLLINLNNDALDVETAASYISPNSVIALYRFDHNPLEISISNIIGIEKPQVVLEKYEPDYGWFAVNRTLDKEAEWNVFKSPDNKLVWADAVSNRIISFVDYIFVFGNYDGAIASGKTDLKKLQQNYTRIFSSDDNKVHILKLNN